MCRDRQKWWQPVLSRAWQTLWGGGSRARHACCPMGTFGDQGSPFARVGWLRHPRISAGGPVLGGCCGILGDAGRPLLSASTLAPAQPPARAELRRSDGSRRLSAVTSRSRPGRAGAPSAPPCSAPASSTRPRWRARAAAWATRIARGARRASRLVPHGPSAVLASRGQVGPMGLSGEGLRGSWFGGFWEKLAGSAVPRRGAGQDLSCRGGRFCSPLPSLC